MRTIGMVTILATCLSWQTAMADEQMSPLEISGAWVAMAHKPSMVSAPDVCVAMSSAIVDAQTGIGIRGDADGFQIRVINKRWSLPDNVDGSVRISVGTYVKSFDVSTNEATMISAEIEKDDLVDLFQAMDKGNSMSIVVGKDKPMVISLNGSTRVTNAFRRCAAMPGANAVPGANPFQ